jgi:cytochrome c
VPGRLRLFLLPGALAVVVVVSVVFTSSASAQTSAIDGALRTGQLLFEKRCGGCHAMDREKEGPRLAGVYGRTAGSVSSFEYSEALKGSGIDWNAETPKS